ncbi:MAG TPA: hypothetical protein VG389_00260, partial [Myxococcota bacterium]|nr:hypothetical protein [Myxococcota bacterium]
VLNYVNYRLVADATVPAADQKFDLVRELLAADGATPLAAVPVTVGEFIVDFEVAATADTAAAGAEPNIPAAPASNALFDGNGVGDNPASARTVIITLTARTGREDPDFASIPRTAATDPIRSFDVDPTIPGAARVRTLRVEVPLTNFVLGTR